MLIAKNYLSHKAYLKARRRGVRTFLFNEIDFNPSDHSGDEFFNCNVYRVQSSWYTWQVNEEAVLALKEKCPRLFELNGYDITPAILKAMFWSNFRTGFLRYGIREDFKDRVLYRSDEMHRASVPGVLLRFFRYAVRRRNARGMLRPEGSRGNEKFIIHIRNDFQAGLYAGILAQAGMRDDFRVFADRKVSLPLPGLGENGSVTVLKEYSSEYPFPIINLMKLSGRDWYVLNIIIKHWKEIGIAMDTAMQLAGTGLKAALINEGENGVYGAVVSEVFRKKGVRTYNTMNGIKSGEAQDSYIGFDRWFVWDEQMKDLMIKRNGLPEEKLIVSGHLAEDIIRKYTYRNSLNIDPETLKDKKVISVFTVKGRRYVKTMAMDILFDMVRNDRSVYLMIRPHPSEKKEDYILPDPDIRDHVRYISYDGRNQSDTLHDQLYLSDLSIVFGSTVALESKWMGVPCITYEVKEDSLIYCVDGKNIVHVREPEELRETITELLGRKKEHVPVHSKPVAEKIMDVMTSLG